MHLKKHNFKESVSIMLYIFIEENDFFNKLIYDEVIFDPLDFRTKEDDMEFIFKVVNAGSIILEKQIDEGLIDKDIHNRFMFEAQNFVVKIKTLYESIKENQNLLSDNDFVNFPFKKQIQMWCNFIESQSIYSDREVENKIKDSGYFTGMETQTVEDDNHNSLKDNLEALLEIFDTLLNFLHFTSHKKIEGYGNVDFKNISPFYIPSIEQISHLTNHKILLENVWDKIKFRKWDYKIYRENDHSTTPVYYYSPPNLRNLKLERAGIIRKSYHEHQSALKPVSFSRMRTLRQELDSHSESVLNDLFSLKTNVFEIGVEIIEPKIQFSMQSTYSKIGDSFYQKNIDEDGDVSLEDIYFGFSYLLSLGYLYSHFSHEIFDESNFKMLCPVVSITRIAADFSSKFSMNKRTAKKIIEYFVLFPSTPNRQKDVFSKPLVYVGNDNIVFTPYIVGQMNLDRITERILSDSEIDESIKGVNLEKELITALSSSAHLKVNNSKVRFNAFDGKEVEYDLIAVFDGKIILIEIKCLNTPYSDYEQKTREEEILKGVAQVNRREEILIKEPEEIIDRINIELPKENPLKEDIVKIVCTDVFHYTGRIEDDVYIIDSSALSKFFLNPKIEVTEMKDTPIIVDKSYIWENNPDISTFKRYLRMPTAVERILLNLEERTRPVMLLSDDSPRLAFADYILKKNPYDRSEAKKTTIKVGRNEKCFCGSGVKYKKCCGR